MCGWGKGGLGMTHAHGYIHSPPKTSAQVSSHLQGSTEKHRTRAGLMGADAGAAGGDHAELPERGPRQHWSPATKPLHPGQLPPHPICTQYPLLRPTIPASWWPSICWPGPDTAGSTNSQQRPPSSANGSRTASSLAAVPRPEARPTTLDEHAQSCEWPTVCCVRVPTAIILGPAVPSHTIHRFSSAVAGLSRCAESLIVPCHPQLHFSCVPTNAYCRSHQPRNSSRECLI